MRGGAGPAAGFSNNKRDLARKTANDHAKERATSELSIISCVMYLFSRPMGYLERSEGERVDKVLRNKYNPRASEKKKYARAKRATILFYYESSRSLVSVRLREAVRGTRSARDTSKSASKLPGCSRSSAEISPIIS